MTTLRSAPLRSRSALLLAAAFGHAATLRVADVGDVQPMDPHSLNETLQLSWVNLVQLPDNRMFFKWITVK